MSWSVQVEIEAEGKSEVIERVENGASAVNALHKTLNHHKLAFVDGDMRITITRIGVKNPYQPAEAGEQAIPLPNQSQMASSEPEKPLPAGENHGSEAEKGHHEPR